MAGRSRRCCLQKLCPGLSCEALRDRLSALLSDERLVALDEAALSVQQIDAFAARLPKCSAVQASHGSSRRCEAEGRNMAGSLGCGWTESRRT